MVKKAREKNLLVEKKAGFKTRKNSDASRIQCWKKTINENRK